MTVGELIKVLEDLGHKRGYDLPVFITDPYMWDSTKLMNLGPRSDWIEVEVAIFDPKTRAVELYGFESHF